MLATVPDRRPDVTVAVPDRPAPSTTRTGENPPRSLRMAHALALLAGAAGALIPACAGPEALAPLAAQHAQTIEALQSHAEASRVILERQLDASLEVQRIALTGRIHRELLRTGLMSPDFEAGASLIPVLLGDTSVDIALVEEIRLGRMTQSEAEAWLTDYALTCRMSQGAEARWVLLARLAPVEQFESAGGSLRDAVARHGDAIAQLIASLRADASAIDSYARQMESRPSWDRARTQALIEDNVLSQIESDERRAAAAELLDLLLTPWDALSASPEGAKGGA